MITKEDFKALPVDTLIRVAYTEPGGSEESMVILRSATLGASSGDHSMRGKSFWDEVYDWADSIEILYAPSTA